MTGEVHEGPKNWVCQLDETVSAFTRRVAGLAVLGMLAFSVLTVVDIVLRTWAGLPIAGLNEVLALILPVTIAACFPAGSSQRVHLTIEFLRRPLPHHAQSWFRAAGHALLLLLFCLLAWRIAVYADGLAARNAVTTILQWPLAPAFWAVSVFFGITALPQLVAVLVQMKDATDLDRSDHETSEVVGDRSSRNALGGAKIAVVICSIVAATFVVALFAACFGVPGFSWLLPSSDAVLAGLLFLVTWIMVALFVPLGVALTLTGLAGLNAVMGSLGMLFNFGIQVSDFLADVNLAVLPLFLMMGSFVVASGLSSDLYRFAQALIGHLRGGLALATVGGCAAFGAVTGLSVATVATIGRVAYPEMRDRGYSTELSTGAIAAGGTLGMLVPPSGAMILYALLTEVSIGKLFIAALVPAAVTIALYMVVIAMYVRLAPASAPKSGSPHFAEMGRALIQIWGLLLLFGTVMGGIYAGYFTATEAAAVGAGLAFLYAILKRKLNKDTWWAVIGETVQSTAMIYVLLIGGLIFANFVAVAQLPDALRDFIISFDLAPLAVIGILLVIYLILGCIMDPFAVMVISVPIFAPLVAGLGFDLIWWGIIMVVVIETGLVTPPLGINVFVLKKMAGDVALGSIFRGVLPFVAADLAQLALLVLFPALVLWLPSTM